MKPKQPEKKWEERWRKRLEKISVYANEQVTGYVIPINEATDFISQLIDEKEIERLIAESKEEALKEVENLMNGRLLDDEFIKDFKALIDQKIKQEK